LHVECWSRWCRLSMSATLR